MKPSYYTVILIAYSFPPPVLTICEQICKLRVAEQIHTLLELETIPRLNKYNFYIHSLSATQFIISKVSRPMKLWAIYGTLMSVGLSLLRKNKGMPKSFLDLQILRLRTKITFFKKNYRKFYR